MPTWWSSTFYPHPWDTEEDHHVLMNKYFPEFAMKYHSRKPSTSVHQSVGRGMARVQASQPGLGWDFSCLCCLSLTGVMGIITAASLLTQLEGWCSGRCVHNAKTSHHSGPSYLPMETRSKASWNHKLYRTLHILFPPTYLWLNMTQWKIHNGKQVIQ